MEIDDLDDIERRATLITDERERADIRALVAALREAWVELDGVREDLENLARPVRRLVEDWDRVQPKWTTDDINGDIIAEVVEAARGLHG